MLDYMPDMLDIYVNHSDHLLLHKMYVIEAST